MSWKNKDHNCHISCIAASVYHSMTYGFFLEECMLQIKDLSIYIKNDMRPLVKGLTFSLNSNDKVAVIGEEGNGKSTLLKAIYNPEAN